MSRNAKYIEKWVGYLNSADREMSRIAANKLGDTKDVGTADELGVDDESLDPDTVIHALLLAAIRSEGGFLNA